jgi:hypothetical protein
MVTNIPQVGSPNNHGNLEKAQPISDNFIVDMVYALCAKKQVELEKINDTEFSKSKPSFT